MVTKDVLIIGGGPIGLACGIAAKRAGLDYVIIEKGALVNSLFHYPLYMTFFSTAERLEIGGIPFSCIRPKPGRQEALEYYRKVVESERLNLRLFCEVQNVSRRDDGLFIIETGTGRLLAKNVIIATGFYGKPFLLNIPGEHLAKVRHYYKEPHEFAFRKVVVVGAQNSAVDAALETYRKGADVTMVVRGAGIGERVKYWIRPDIVNRIEEGSVKAHFNSRLVEIKEQYVIVETPTGILEIENDFVLAMTGYRPDNSMLHSLGVEFSRDEKNRPVYREETMETNISNLFLAGVICGGVETHRLIIENSRVHADRIIDCILERKAV